MKEKFIVEGMSCSSCSAHVEKSVGSLNGVKDVQVNLLQKSMMVDYDHHKIKKEMIIDTVQKAGYEASLCNPEQSNKEKNTDEKAHNSESEDMKKRLYISIIFLIPLLYLSMGHLVKLPLPIFLSGHINAVSFGLTQLLLVLPVMYSNRKFYQVGYRALFKGSPNMDTLIAIGSTAAFVYGVFAIYRMGYGLGIQDMKLVAKYHGDLYFESVSMILTLITVGKFLEEKSKGRTSDAIKKIMSLAPQIARIIQNGMEIEVPIEKLAVDDIVVIKQGEKVPCDGMIIEGYASFDESSLTGESIPVEKQIGDSVISATINKSGYVKIKARKVGADTTLSQIIRLVEDASGSKAPIARLADKISGYFVPVVMGISLITGCIWLLSGHGFEFALSSAIAVLVISCPCALGLATPTAIMVGTGRGAEKGILIKSAESLEIAHHIQTLILDKTGTITKGKPEVTDIFCVEGISEEELLMIAGSLEKPSEHPLAEAIVKYCEDAGTLCKPIDHFLAIPGQGIEGSIEGQTCIAGNRKMLVERKIEFQTLENSASLLSEEGKTVLYFAKEDHILGYIAVADNIKETSLEAIKAFQNMGIDVVMLTGDQQKTAEAIQKRLGIKRVIAEVLPQDKEREVRRLQEEGKIVAMIGDGINDAPALARADVGIAIGAGTDIAMESADIVLMKSDLLDAVQAIELSKAVIRNIKQNLFWAFFYNVLGIPLAAGIFYPIWGVRLSPMFGAAAMSLSSIFVVTNALRLRHFQSKKKS